MRVVDNEKFEVGITAQYRKSFKGTGRDGRDCKASIKKYRDNYDKINWGKK